MCEIYVKVAGNWEQVNTVYVKIGGVWETITEGWHKVNNAWRIFWQPNGFVPFTQTFYEPNRPPPTIPAFSFTAYAPCGATSLTVEMYGGGGSGASKLVGEGSSSQAGSGGGGQYTISSPIAVSANQAFLGVLPGLARPGSNTYPNPYVSTPVSRQDGENGGDSRITRISPFVQITAYGGGGGQPGTNSAGGGQDFSFSPPGSGLPIIWGAASGQGGDAGGPAGGSGGQSSPPVAATPYGGGGAGGINGSDGSYGSPGIIFMHWS